MSNNNTGDNSFVPGIPGYSFEDLYSPHRLRDLFDTFGETLKTDDPELYTEYQHYHSCSGDGMSPQAVSDLLVRLAPHVGQFVARLFNIEQQHAGQQKAILDEVNSIFVFRDKVVGKLKSRFKNEDICNWDIQTIQQNFDLLKKVGFPDENDNPDSERSICLIGNKLVALANYYLDQTDDKTNIEINADDQIQSLREKLIEDEQASRVFDHALKQKSPGAFVNELLEYIQRWCYVVQTSPGFEHTRNNWTIFKTPKKTDFQQLVHHDTRQHDGFTTWIGNQSEHRRRDGFKLTDKRFNQRQVQYEVDHCIYCHDRDTDSCSKGMRNKRAGDFKSNPLGVMITGCPLEEKISEMHVIKRAGDNIGALALITIDNPMCPGTGHRICNDCMKGCIYQKTEPVNIPQIETNVLTDVLFMSYGFEIYSLLTRWNPLNVNQPYAKPYNGKNVLVVGMGPAGYTLSHYLLNEGFGVVGVDALKIEPLPDNLVNKPGGSIKPIKDFNNLYEELDQRMLAGFGGVAEYGITVRWDKNFLKVIYLNLARRYSFRCYGGVRFGGTITIEEAWDMGFDHIAIASGAGKPTIIGLKNNLIRGIRKASDFLMALQLTGAAKESSLANLQVRLPAGIIGGGLTAIDTTTEVMAYYPVQVEKILHRYEKLVEEKGEQEVRKQYDEEELIILDEFLEHGRAVRAERQRAKDANEQPDFKPLIEKWGGVILFYRKGINDSPAYRQNHEEIHEALQEGIQLAEGMNPVEAFEDKYGALRSVKFDKLVEKEGQWLSEKNILEVPLKSLFIAAGTSPNTIYEQEHPYSFRMDAKFFKRYEPHWKNDNEPELVPMDDTALPKIGKPAPLTSYHKDGKYISFYGDNHPVYAGNVVKAMASAKDGYPYILQLFSNELKTLEPGKQKEREQLLYKFFNYLDGELIATVISIQRLAPTIIEVIVKAPMQARKFSPGQFYRVQNLESFAPVINNTALAAEGLALTGAWVDKDKGLISLIALEMGSSSRLCALWKPGEPVVVMGVTGEATQLTKNKTVMLIGGGLGNAVQFSIGKALRAAGNRVIYFAGYRKREDVFKVEEIEQASDVIVWAVDHSDGVEPIPTTREQDKSCVGNILEAIESYAKGELGETDIKLEDVDHMIVIGSDRMMAAVKEARHSRLKPYLKPQHTAIGSINSPMQCMMKGVCAQCLCKHIDPQTGEEYFVYSCYNQDQELDRVDFTNLNARLRQNTVQEKLSNLWLDHLLESTPDLTHN